MQISWDPSIDALRYNDIDAAIVSSGLQLFACSHESLIAGLSEPDVYSGSTLWTSIHDRGKIARVIDAWAHGVALTPIFLVKHGRYDFGLVADGKHRLTVLCAIGTLHPVPFMVAAKDSAWVASAMPSATTLEWHTIARDGAD